MSTNVSILAEIPEDLHLSMQGYLDNNPDWDQDRVFSAAISLFLLQNTVENTPEASLNYRRAARVYLETLFRDGPQNSTSEATDAPGSTDAAPAAPESVTSVNPVVGQDGVPDSSPALANDSPDFDDTSQHVDAA